MTPLPDKPTVVILIDDADRIVGVASNIAPLSEFKVEATRSQRLFDEMALGKPFNQSTGPKTSSDLYVATDMHGHVNPSKPWPRH